jgi:DNA invertase Pin-like site-specific DNA recombinase
VNASNLVAGYYRISQARDDMSAPAMYEEEIRRYCTYKQLHLKKVFSDIDYSGYKDSEKRPALSELVRRRGEFSCVVIPKLSRFGRSVRHLTQLFDVFDRDGIALVFLDLGMDTSTSQGRLLRHVMAAFAEYESDVKSDYIRASYKHLMRQGRAWGGTPPFGFDKVPETKSYVINPGRAEIVRAIFEMYRAGRSQSAVSKVLNRQGRLRPSGSLWTTQQVGRMLDNPAYAGLCLVDGDFSEATWEPIVARALWDEVREKRRIHGGFYRAKQIMRGPYLLSGLIHCGACGRRLHHRARSMPDRGRYGCPNSYSGGPCPGGGIETSRADAQVEAAFLERARFTLVPRPGSSWALDPAHAWQRASLEERRALLRLAMKRVTLEPWPQSGWRPGMSKRRVDIQWAGSLTDPDEAMELVAPEASKADVSNGRVDRSREHMAVADMAARDASDRARSERSRAYFRDWRATQERVRKENEERNSESSGQHRSDLD